MPDMAIISGVLSSLKAASDIAKALRDTDIFMQTAELRLKVADLVGTLADAKLEIASVQDALEAKTQRIVELEQAFEIRHRFVRSRDAYYFADDDGRVYGVPYCLRCWDVEHKARQLVGDAVNPNAFTVCHACGKRYAAGFTGTIDG